MYAWDFWLLEYRGQWHLFHLQAPRGKCPEWRHHVASVGHAVSSDLRSWEPRPTAFEAGPEGDWDDRCIWTGSMLEWNERFWFLYTARKRDGFLLQKIGLAVSDDLEHWERHPDNPVMTADPRWYQTRPGGGLLEIEDWRDPYLCLVAGRPTALISARTAIPQGTWKLRVIAAYLKEFARMWAPLPLGYPSGKLAGRGCVAMAQSDDMVHWEVRSPVFSPGRYDCLECPQHFIHEGRHYLTFSTLKAWYHRDWSREIGGGQTGMHAYHAPSMEGPWEPCNGNGVVLGTKSRCYATRMVKRDGQWQALSWRFKAEGHRGFCGMIDSPRSVTIDGATFLVAD